MGDILIIDDEEDMRSVVASMLEAEGFSTRQAPSAEDGLVMIRKACPDIIISDINMERMTGFDFLEEVRKDPATAGVPFIFITGVGGRITYRHGMELGADDFLEKPFSRDELLASVRTRLRAREVVQQQSEQKLQDLRSSISQALPHEFRTPLTAVLAFSKILRDDKDVAPEEVRKFSGMIHASAERLHRLVENYLMIADLEVIAADPEGVAHLRAQTAERVSTIVGSTVHDAAEHYMRSKDLMLDMAQATCRMSRDHLAKVVHELTDNAFKFSKPGTPVTVTARSEGKSYLIEISDKGDGMSRDQMERANLFQQFGRKKREQQGAGFGLGLAKRLVELYGGTLTLASGQGTGTTASVTLERVAEEKDG